MRKSPQKHIVKTHNRKNGKTHVKSYTRGQGTNLSKIANPVIKQQNALSVFNNKIRLGKIPLEQVNMYRIWFKDPHDVFQDIPARNEKEAIAIQAGHNQSWGMLIPKNIEKIELLDLGTQINRAYIETNRETGGTYGGKVFDKKLAVNKAKRGIANVEYDYVQGKGNAYVYKGELYSGIGLKINSPEFKEMQLKLSKEIS